MNNDPIAVIKAPTILLVEDLADDVFFFKIALRRAALQASLHVAEDGLQAIDYFSNKGPFADPVRCPRPDIVFLDLKMPNMNGLEVLEWIDKHPFTPPLRVIVLTGSEEPSDLARARALGAEAYLIKPLAPEMLKSLLRQSPAAAPPSSASAQPGSLQPPAGSPPP